MKSIVFYILNALFFLFVLRSIYSLFSIYQAPQCKPNDVCYKSFLNAKPNLDLFVFLSDNSKQGNYDLILHLEKFNYTVPFIKELTIELSKTTRNNGSLFIHSIIIPSPLKKLSIEELVNVPDATYLKNKITKYAVPVSAAFNLLNEKKAKNGLRPVSHLRSKYALIMCTEELNVPHNEVPFELYKYFRVNSRKEFLPIVQQDMLQMRLHDLVELDINTKTANLTYIYTPASLGKIRFLLQTQLTLQQFLSLGFTERDLDEVKGVFADTNLYLLCATVFIGSVHLLLDFLSFKNDISFWRGQKSMAGLSTRTVIWRAFSQTIVFLYLLDQGTSLLILIPSAVATLIEFWKVQKVLKPSISFKGISLNKRTETVEEKETRQYDEECMTYLSYLLYPLCIGAAVYSLIYQPHKSWYSWTINSLVNGVYAFGFLFMLPQLFINYRLKSVAALPWRAFTYKAFNTIVDDVFAFIITMPTAHRVACFRDDVIFVIYLYQRWLYPVDKTRVDDATIQETIPESSKTKKTN